MNTQEVLRAVRDAIGKHTGDERELYEALEAEAEGWSMRLQELEDEARDDHD